MKTLPLYSHERSPCLIEETAPLELDSNCTRCSLHKRATTRCMQASLTGPEGTPTLYVLGQGPTQQEDRVGQPMVGQVGQYVRGLVQRHWPGQVIYDNALRCSPGRDKIKPAMIGVCSSYGAAVWQQSQAARVVLLGREAMASFLGRGHPPFSVRRGYTYTSTGVPVFLLLPPSAAVRNRFIRAWFEEDMQWALSTHPAPLPPPRASLVWCVQTEEDFEQALADLELAPWVTFDCETFGAPHNQEFRILDVALTPGGMDYAYSFDRLAAEKFGPRLGAFLSRAEVRVGGHGVKFDVLAFRAAFGQWIKPDFDTMWLRRFFESDVDLNLDDAQTSVGMTGGKSAVERVDAGVIALRKEVKGPGVHTKNYIAPSDWWHSHSDTVINRAERELAVERVREGDEPRRYAYASIPFEQRSCYNALDTISTDRIHRRYRARTDEEGQRAWSVWRKIGKSMNHALTAMEYNGVKADKAKIHELITLCDTRIQAIELDVAQQFPGQTFNFHSGSPDTARLLFDIIKLKPAGLTPSGRRQCNAETLEKLDHPVATAIIEWRQRSHFKAQYAVGMLQALRDDGRIHTSIKGVGAGTGRPSSEDPNLFNLPRLDTGEGSGKMCRDVLIADPDDPYDPFTGELDPWEFVEVDQSQVELRVAAMLSNDQRMIEVFMRGGDVHLEAAILTAPMLKVDVNEVKRLGKKHPHRSNTKAVVFGAMYGEPEGALAKKLGISRAQAKRLQDAIFGHFVRLKEWCREQLNFSRRTGYCYTWWDGQWFRRRLLTEIATPGEGAADTAERSSWNTPIQGTAADFTNASLGAVQEWIEARWPGNPNPPCRLVLTVYDSILLEVRGSVRDEAARKVKQIMESWPTLNGMPLVGEVKVGQRFGSLEDYELEDEHGAIQ